MKTHRLFSGVAAQLRALRSDSSGNVMLLSALAMPVMTGSVGLGVDVSQWYLWKRELQYMVDQAAMTGAMSLQKDANGSWQAQAVAQFSLNSEVVDFVGTPSVTKANYGTGTNNSVTVSATASKALPFSQVFLPSGVEVTVSAQAAFLQQADYTSCIVATNETESGVVNFGGSGIIQTSCGVAALSTADDAITVTGNGVTLGLGNVITAGDIYDPHDKIPDSDEITHVTNLQDPFNGALPPTSNGISRSLTCVGKGNKATATAQPGVYTSLNISCNTTFNPGVYELNGGSFNINGNNTVSGSNVMFVLKNGATIRFNGTAAITLSGPTETQLSAAPFSIADAAQRAKLAGMLVFEDTSSPGGASLLNGNASTTLNGKFYLKRSTLEVKGNAKVSSQCLMMVADKVNFTGNADIRTLCPIGVTHTNNNVGGGRNRISLVA